MGTRGFILTVVSFKTWTVQDVLVHQTSRAAVKTAASDVGPDLPAAADVQHLEERARRCNKGKCKASAKANVTRSAVPQYFSCLDLKSFFKTTLKHSNPLLRPFKSVQLVETFLQRHFDQLAGVAWVTMGRQSAWKNCSFFKKTSQNHRFNFTSEATSLCVTKSC